MRKNFIIFDLNGVLCQSTHISNSASKGPYRTPQDMDYGGRFDTVINKKVVRVRPGLRCFLREVLGLAHVIIWSSMLMDNTKAVVSFLFRELAMPCLLLGQEHCDDLYDRSGKIVPKVGGGPGPQFLKVLRKNLWVGVPMLEGVPQGYWPTPENTLLIDDSPAKSVLNPPGNCIFPNPWEGDRNDNFLELELGPYIRRLAHHSGSVPDFVLSNRIGNRPLGPRDTEFRRLYGFAELNKLV
jgi:hypothetical protein